MSRNPNTSRDLSGQRVNPWRYLKWLYLVDATTGVISTLEVGSVGGLMSVAELGQQIAGMRQLKGAEALPVIELGRTGLQDQVRAEEAAGISCCWLESYQQRIRAGARQPQ